MSTPKKVPHLNEIITRTDGLGNETKYRITAIFGENDWVICHNAMKAHRELDGVKRDKGIEHGRWCVFSAIVNEPCKPTFRGAHLVYAPEQ